MHWLQNLIWLAFFKALGSQHSIPTSAIDFDSRYIKMTTTQQITDLAFVKHEHPGEQKVVESDEKPRERGQVPQLIDPGHTMFDDTMASLSVSWFRVISCHIVAWCGVVWCMV